MVTFSFNDFVDFVTSKRKECTYVEKSELNKLADQFNQYVIVRTYSAGVFAGYLSKKEGKEVVLENARRLWYWEGAASLSQLATDGTSEPEKCKFPCVLKEITLLEAIEIIPVSNEAKESISKVKVWTA